jgi:hypothetical protein
METLNQKDKLVQRNAPLNMSADEFRKVGHQLVEQIANFYKNFQTKK